MQQIIAGIAGAVSLVVLWRKGSATTRAVLTRNYGFRTVATVGLPTSSGQGKQMRKRRYLVWSTPDNIAGRSFRQKASRIADIGLGDKIAVYVRGDFSVWEGDVGTPAVPKSSVPKVDRD